MLAVPLSYLAPTNVAQALTLVPMTRTETKQVHGDFILVGNGVLGPQGNSSGNTYSYPPSGLYTGVTSTSAANDYYYMTNVGAGTGFSNSSSATFTVPNGASVVSAKVLWSANTGDATNRLNTCDNNGNTATKPSGSPSTATITVVVNGTTQNYAPSNYNTDAGAAIGSGQLYYYSANADVTAQFAGFVGDGTAKTVKVGNIWAPTGKGCYGGWSLELIYDFGRYDPTQPDASQLRTVYVYDGYARKFTGDPADTINLTNLQPQGAGARMGSVAWEGDASIAGDYITYQDPTTATYYLPNAQQASPPASAAASNYFTGVADGAVNYGGTSGTFYNGSVSAQSAPLPGLVAGDTSLTLRLGTSSDSYLVQNVVISVPNADVQITKTAANGEADQAIAPGATPGFRITVYNSGSVPITKISVTDAQVPGCARDEATFRDLIRAQYPTAGADGNYYIPAGGSVQYTCTGVPTTEPYDNVARVNGQTGTGIPVASSDVSKVLIAKWEVTKAAKYPDVPTGTNATWVINVKNTGSADIYNVTVKDPAFPACERTVPLVQAGQTLSYECQGVVSTTTTNTLSATGTGKAAETSTITVPLTANNVTATVQVSAVTVSKTASKPVVNVGESVTFTFVVKNTGTAVLNTVSLTDPDFPSCSQANVGPLAAGASKTVTCTVTPYQAAAQTTVTNRVTVVGTPPSGQTVTATDQVDVNNKSLKLAKTATTTDVNNNGVLDAGDRVTYGFTVTNTGSSTLTGVKVTDPKLAGATITCTPTTLTSGANATCTASAPYTVTQADVDAGALVNTATATGTATDGSTTTGTATVTLTPVQQPAIKVVKTASPNRVTALGQLVTYTFVVTNSGNTSLSQVTLTDPLPGLSAITCKNAGGTTVTMPTSLAPNAALTCTATRATTQADLDAGKVNNTATANGTSPKGTIVSGTGNAVVNATQTPALAFTKSADATTFATVGQVIKYTFTTKNTGNVTLTGVQMTDPMARLASRSCTPAQPADLAPGESVVCTATLTVTQADIDGGAIVNTATVTANPPTGAALTDTKSWTVTPATAPGIALDKSASRTSVTAAGQTITYTLTATNQGNTTLSGVTITDPMSGLVMGTCTPASGATLVPGGKMSCTATYTTTQADIDRGAITNTATASGTDSHGDTVSTPATREVTATATPGIQLTKSASPSQITGAGQVVTYTFAVKNSGNVTLSNLRLTDQLAGLSAITCSPVALGGSLAPNQTTTCTATRTSTLADMNAGAVNNSATVLGRTPAGTDTSATSTAKVTATQNPSYTTVKSANPTAVTKAGEVVTYSIVVTNNGNVSLSNLRVSDPKLASLTCTPTALGGTLVPGATTTCTGKYTATQLDVNTGTINNTETTTLTPPTGADMVKTSSAVVTSTAAPALTTTKTSSTKAYAKVGDQINYTITTTNSGNVTLTNVGISDPMFPAASPLTCTPAAPATLQPGDTMTCTGTHSITQGELDAGTLTNVATGSGRTPTGTTITSTSSVTATATQTPAYTLTKSSSPTSVSAPGRLITYTVVLTNTGNVSLTNAQISDPKVASFTSCTPALGSKIAPGGTMTCTGTYTSTQADIDAGSITNTASSQATPPTGPVINRTATNVVDVGKVTTLSMTKTASPTRVTAVGQTITYTFRVTNSGNVTASSVAVTDPMPGLSAVSCTPTTLAPGAVATCTATRTSTQADLNLASGVLSNTATATAKDPQGSAFTPTTASADVTMAQTPKLSITKAASPTTVSAVGVPVKYTIVVTNTGNVDVSNVQVSDNLINAALVSCTPAKGSTLAPNATMTCTATRNSTQADLDAGRVVNTATATGTAPNGSAVTPPTAQATVTATQTPSIKLTKTPSVTTVAAVGDKITYSYLVENTGNVTLGSVAISDPHPGLTAINCAGVTSLAPKTSMTCTASYSVTQTDLIAGSIPDTATVKSEAPGGDPASAADDVTDTSSALVTATQSPALAFSKTANVTSYSATGRTITYTLTAQNTGNVELKNVRIVDPHTGLSALNCTPAQGSTLAPLATMSCTATYTTTQADLDATKIDNKATATATAPGNKTLSQEAALSIPATLSPAMTLSKSASPTTVTTLGQTVNYTFTVTNTGNVTLHGIAVTDVLPGLSAVTCDTDTLAPTKVATCSASYKVTQADLDKGSIANSATLNALDPTNKAVPPRTATATVQATQTPKLVIAKKSDVTGVKAVGDVINYTFTVTNSGNVTASQISVTDALVGLSPITCPATVLAPGGSFECQANYTVKQSDLDNGKVTNTATVRGLSPSGVAVPPATDSVTVPAAQTATRTFTKTADKTHVSTVGEVITYTFEVVNTGNVTLGSVLVSDDMYKVGMSTLSCNVYASDGVTIARPCAGSISLAPGEIKRRVATYTVKQSDLDAGSIPNTASLGSNGPDGTPLTPLTSSWLVTSDQTPSMSLTKTSDTPNYSAVGQVATYTFVLTNTGNVSLSNATITDPMPGLSPLNCTPAQGSTLAPRASLRCTATYTVKQSDLDATKITNTATGKATPPSGGDLTQTTTRTFDAVLNPGISLVKSASPNPATTAGQEITYSFLVTNTGNVKLDPVTVTDPMPGLSAISCPATSLAPEGTMTCTATATLTQAQVNAGAVSNTAKVQGTDPKGTVVERSSSTTVRITQSPKLTLDKTADLTTVKAAGETITYTFVVANAGNVTINDLKLTDPMLGQGELDCPATTLAPGADMTCSATHEVTQAEIDGGKIVNNASVTGSTQSGTPVTPATDSVTINVDANPAWTFTKTPNLTQVTKIDQRVVWTLVVTNTGNVTLNDVFIDDPVIGGVNWAGCRVVHTDGTETPTSGPSPLAPGEKKICEVDRIFAQADFEKADPNTATSGIDWVNVATVNAKTPQGTAMTPLDAEATVFLQPAPDFKVTKTANVQGYTHAGQVITYNITAQNTGNVALSDVQIVDTKLAGVVLSCSPAARSTLQPGQVMSCQGQYTVTQGDVDNKSITNEAYGRGTDPQGVVHDSTVPGRLVLEWHGQTGLSLSKTATPAAVNRAGDSVTFTFDVHNLGDITVTDMQITDQMVGLSAVTCPTTTVAPKTSVKCTATYTATQADINAGSFKNDATVTGQVGTVTITDVASTTVTAAPQPAITLKKTNTIANGDAKVSAVGQQVNYSFLVTNTGNVPLSGVTITDTKVQGVSCPKTTLEPLEPMTCTATYAATQSDLDTASFVNNATVTGTDLKGTEVQAFSNTTTPTDWRPALTLDKTASVLTVDTVGQVVTYTFKATNTGNVTLYNTFIADKIAGLSSLTCVNDAGQLVVGASTLAPNETKTCTGARRVTQADLDAGSILNTATVTSSLPNGTTGPTGSGSAVITSTQTPKLTVTKTVNRETYAEVGEELTYQFTVRNDGNVTVQNVQLTDPLPGLGELSCLPAQGSNLAPNTAMNCTATKTVTQADIDAKTIKNTASATGSVPGLPPVTGTSNEVTSTAEIRGGIDLIKTADRTSIDNAGDVITYTFTATNTGNSTLSGVTITDPMPDLSALTCTPAAPAVLAPKAVITCTATHTVTQSEIDEADPARSIGISNTATAVGTDALGNVSTDNDQVTIQVQHRPALTLTKTADRDAVATVAEVVTYTFTVKNTGNVRLVDLKLTDAIVPDATCPSDSLDPGQEIECTGTLTVDQGHLDHGGIPNTASVSASDPDGDLSATAQDDLTVSATQSPKLSLTKSVSPTTVDHVGQPMTYTFTATNDGNVTLDNVLITDPIDGLSTLDCGAQTGAVSLHPGEVKQCTATRVATQADIDAGTINNTATSTANAPTGPIEPVKASAVADVDQQPAITTTKSATKASYATVGEVIGFNIAITNTGNTSLTDVQLGESLAGLTDLVCTPQLGSTLVAGQTMQCTANYTVTQADLDAKQITNVATGSGVGPNTTRISDPSDEVVVTADLTPAITLVKRANPTTVTKAGEVVTYTFEVQNTGNATLYGVAVSDLHEGLSDITCEGATPTVLAPQQSMECTATYTVTQDDMDKARPEEGLGIDNDASVTGTDAAGTSATADATATVQVQHLPELSMTKEVTPTTYSKLGDVLTYTFTITNSGNVTLTDLVLTDPLPDLTPFECSQPLADPLKPGESMTCTSQKTIFQTGLNRGSINNTATVTGHDPDGAETQPSQATAIATAIQNPSMTLSKAADKTTVNAVGDVITYTFEMVNTGNVTLTNTVISDPLPGLSALSCEIVGTDGTKRPGSGPASVNPGETKVCTATKAATQADLDAGSILNTAKVDATSPKGQITTSSNPVTVQVIQDAALELVKTVSPTRVAKAGDVVTYDLAVTNTGTVTLHDIRLTEQMPGLFNYRCGTTPVTDPDAVVEAELAPGEVIHCMADKALTPEEMNQPTLVNHARATGVNPTDPDTVIESTSSATIIPVHTPKLALFKSHDVTAVDTVGQKVTFSFKVTNVGNITVDQIAVEDEMPGLSAVTCPVTELAPAAETTCTATYTVTQADLDRGRITNQATVTGRDPIGGDPVVPGEDSDEVVVNQTGSLKAEKTAVTTAPVAVGDDAVFKIVVTNTGNVTLSDVRVEDGQPNLRSLTCEPTQPGTLAPGATMTCMATVTTTQGDVDYRTVSNYLFAYGKTPQGVEVEPGYSDAEVPTVEGSPSATFTKTADRTAVSKVGDVITYTFTVTNTGSLSLSTPYVTDAKENMSAVSCNHDIAEPLQPREVMTCTATYTVTQADLDAGEITNSADFYAGVPLGDPIHLTATEKVTATQQPALLMVKTADRSAVSRAGDVINYTFAVTNTGNVGVAFVTIDDQMPGLGELSCVNAAGDAVPLPTSVAPGASLVCQTPYTVTQADMNAGSIVNVAKATGRTTVGTPVSSNPGESVVTTNRDPNIELTKDADQTLVQKVGDQITYTIKATNVGNVSISDATITDPMPMAEWTCHPPEGNVLEPGAEMTCTGVYTVQHTDLEAGHVTNLASFTGTAPGGSAVATEAGTTVPALYNPKMEFVKAVTGPQNWVAGDELTYTFHVENVGNMTAYNVIGSDTMADLSTLRCYAPEIVRDADGNIVDVVPFGGREVEMGSAPMQPGEFVDCRATYTVKQADVDRGFIVNTAKLTAEESTGHAFPVETSTARTETTQTPSMTFVKTADVANFDHVGQILTYTFTVKNTGQLTLSGGLVEDKLPRMGLITCDKQTIAPQDTMVCTAPYVVTQADMDRGTLVNTASFDARDPHGNQVGPIDSSVTLKATTNPQISLTKASQTSQVTAAGEVVQFTLVAANTGNVTARGVTISDPGTTLVGCDQAVPATLAPGDALNCTVEYTVTQDDINRGRLTNVATAEGLTPQGVKIPQATASKVVVAQRNPAVTLKKVADKATFTTLGEKVTYTLTATNSGNVTLFGATITDPMAGLGDLNCTPGQPAQLEPGQTLVCTAVYTVTQADLDRGTLENTAKVTSETLDGDRTNPADDVTATSSTTVTGVSKPALSLVKKADVEVVDSLSDPIVYSFVVTNTGNVTLHDVLVQDPKTGQGMTPIDCPATVLAPGEEMTCKASFMPAQLDLDNGTIPNTATVTGTDPFGNPASPGKGSTTVAVQQLPDYSITKSADHVLVTYPGERVLYTFIGTNTGNVTLHVVEITDPLKGLGAMDCYPRLPADLPPGARIVCRAWYNVSQADLDRGGVLNTASINAVDPKGEPLPTKTDDEQITTVVNEQLQVTKLADPQVIENAGEVVEYTFLAKNLGNQTVENVKLVDEMPGLSAITCADADGVQQPLDDNHPVTLAPNEERTCLASYTATQDDIDAGVIHNTVTLTATRNGKPLEPAMGDAKVITPHAPDFTVAKVADRKVITTAGEQVKYTFTVTNSGNVTLTGLSLSDQMAGLSPITCDQDLDTARLRPGQQLVCEASYSVTQADLDRGELVNTVAVDASAPAQDGSDVPVKLPARTATAKVTAEQAPKVTFSKVATPDREVTVGDEITYTFTATNEGNTTATVVSLEDQMVGLGTPTCDTPLPAQLAPGQVVTCTARYTVTPGDPDQGTVVNSATITVVGPKGVVPVPPASAVVVVEPHPSASISKSAELVDLNHDGIGQPGETVDYTITVKNTGDVTLTDATVVDPMLPKLTCAPAAGAPLAPGETRTCVGSHVITEAEAKGGTLVNTATLRSSMLEPVEVSASVPTAPVKVPPPTTLPETGATGTGAEGSAQGGPSAPWGVGVGLVSAAGGVMLVSRRKKEIS